MQPAVTLSNQIIYQYIRDYREVVPWSSTHPVASNVDCRHLCGYDTDKRDILVDVDAFSNEILTEPPHLISAEILVLECELYIIRLARVFIKLNRHCRHRVGY